jgi:hypothetical protein
MTPLEAILNPRVYQALEVIRPILAAAGRFEPDMRQIVVTKSSIREFSSYNGLTDAILDHDMPELTGTTALDHYTRMSGFKGVMATQELRLLPITSRLPEGELDTFAAAHNLKGYIDAKGMTTDLLKAAAADLFYTSFCRAGPNDHLWDVFGDNGNGYRLRFEVTPRVARIREIRYDSTTTLLKQVNDALVAAGLPRFVLKGVSGVGAFFLPMTWSTEDETRLLAKRFPGGGAPVWGTGANEYWPIPIGIPNATAELKLVEIGVRNLDAAIVSSRLPGWCASLPIVTD